MMNRDELELFTELARFNTGVPTFFVELMDGRIPPEAEELFALTMRDLADRLLAHAKDRAGFIHDDTRTPPLVIDAPFSWFDAGGRPALPPSGQRSGGNGE